MKSKIHPHLSEYRKLTDLELVHRYAHRHEQGAMNMLYERYSHLVLGVSLKYLNDTEAAKDATQQVFIKLLDDLPRFQILNFKPWLMQVTRNHCLMYLRKSVPVTNNTISLQEDMDFEEDWHHEREQDKEDLLQRMEEAMKGLNEEQKICLELFYLEHHTYSAIAQKTGYSIMSVKSHIQNGKRNLRIRINAMTPKTEL